MKMKKIVLLILMVLCINIVTAETLRLELDPTNFEINKYFVFNDMEYYMSFTGGSLFNHNITIIANYYDSSTITTYPTEHGLANINNGLDVISIEVYNNDVFVYEKNIEYCNFNGVCEPCDQENCEVSENALVCDDCSNDKKDMLCNPVTDSICDPDCFNNADKDCEDMNSCEDFSYITCKEREYCTGELLYIEELNELCCSEELCEEIIIEDTYDDLSFDQKEKKKVTGQQVIIILGIILFILALYFIKKQKIITFSLFGILILLSVFFLSPGPNTSEMYQVTGRTIDTSGSYNFNFVPLSDPIYDYVKISYDINFVIDKLTATHPDAISITDSRRTNLNQYQYLPNVEVPLPIVMGIIGTESGGYIYPISHQTQAGSCLNPGACACNSLGYCGLMQVNEGKCTTQNGCNWNKFLSGNAEEIIDNQVSPGIRYMAQMAAYLVKNGMDPDHPDIWYFAAMAYNGGLGRVMCGNSACDELDGTIIGNLMKLKRTSDINDVSFNDLLETLGYSSSGLQDQGAFNSIRVSISNSGADQMVSHAMRTMAFAQEFMENEGYVISETDTTPISQDSSSIPEEILTGEKIGFYYLNPSFRVLEDFDLTQYTGFEYDVISETEPSSESVSSGTGVVKAHEIKPIQITPSESLTAYPGIPIDAPQTNREDNRDPEIYSKIIDQFGVETNPRYKKNLQGEGETYCNIFVWDVTKAMGAEIPHWVNNAELNANSVVSWLLNTEGHDWKSADANLAQNYANQGKPAVAAKARTGTGHIAMVRPGKITDDGPVISQAGGTNFNYGTVMDGFYTLDVLYFVHE